MAVHRLLYGQSEDAKPWIVHYGSKSTPLIAYQLRKIGFRSRIVLPEDCERAFLAHPPEAVILSGGPKSVYGEYAPALPPILARALAQGMPFFGICYGAQLLAHHCGGHVEKSSRPEYGFANLRLERALGGYRGGRVVMNHGDEVVQLPKGWINFGSTPSSRHALFGNGTIFGALFHPEVEHTDGGWSLLTDFLYSTAKCIPDYAFDEIDFVNETVPWIREAVSDGSVIVALSGGIDSALAHALSQRAIGNGKTKAVFVQNGLMRQGEQQQIQNIFGYRSVRYLNCSREFLQAIEQIPFSWDVPQGIYFGHVRRVIGETFLKIFARTLHTRGYRTVCGIVQGTSNADVIETMTGLKQHHNVMDALVRELGLTMVEPLAGLFKNEIRLVAAYLGMTEEVVWREPFPGVGLAVRMWGPVTRAKIAAVRDAQSIVDEIIRAHFPDLRQRPSQTLVALDPMDRRGLVGDEECDGWQMIVRAVQTESFITAAPFDFPPEVEDEITYRLQSKVMVDNRIPIADVLFSKGPKPPTPIEPH